MAHTFVGNLTIIGSDDGLSHAGHQAIIWTDVEILSIWRQKQTYICIEIHIYSCQKMLLKISSGKCWPFCLGHNVLTHWGRVTHICVGKLTIIGSDYGLSPETALSHYLNQCWNIVNWILGNKLHRNFNRNSNISIHENALEDVVCELASILSQPQCVKDPKDAVRQCVHVVMIHAVKPVCSDHLSKKNVTCDLFSNVFEWRLKLPNYPC